jgi:hypothetical protein
MRKGCLLMDKNAEMLQMRLEDLEAGKPLEACLDGLSKEEAELLRLASAMREFEPPARNPSIVAEQLTNLKQLAGKDKGHDTVKTKVSFLQRNAWFVPGLAATMLVLFGFLTLLGLGFGGWAVVRLDRLDNDPARVQLVRGIFEFQARDGSWQPVGEKARLSPGTRVRTRELSSALLVLQDGSALRLGPSTEITLDQMDRFLLGVRIVRITQWRGETSHEVQLNEKVRSLYEVRTPSAAVIAKGTAFSVRVRADLLTRVYVNEGTVDVTGTQATIALEPGQISSVAVERPPEEPALLVSGEGIVTVLGTNWVVAGENIIVDESTEVAGDPQPGDLVSFEGRQLPDGTVLADRLEHLILPETNMFTFSGEMEDIASSGLIVEGRFIGTNQRTDIKGNMESGETVLAKGVIEADGSWLATSVSSPTSGLPFQFVGVFQSREADTWSISGLEIMVDENTVIDPNTLPGDIVEVTGWIRENGSWLAGSIQPVLTAEARFDFTGTVESIDPWVISGIPVVIRLWTFFEAGVQPGDRVHVQGPVLEDGTWVASAITLVDEIPEDVTLEITGIVNNTDPWVVSGIQLVVDAGTQLSGEIVTGSLVRVRATLQPGGVWHADEISLIVPESMGCVTFASVVTSMEGDQISLQNGMTIDLNDVQEIDGVVEVESVILVTKCLAPDGVVSIPLIQVLSSPIEEPSPTPTPTTTNTPAPVSVILPNCYKITFLGFTDHGDGTSTWRYRVEELSCAQDLSNWVLELPACVSVVNASPSPWEVVQPDPNFQLNGIKWEAGTGFQSGEFSVTLEGELTSGAVQVQVGAKGPDVAIGQIAGPACDLLITATPTVTFTPSPTLTGTTDATSTLTPLPPEPVIQHPPSSGTILITDNNQTLTFTCNGNAVEVRGNANIITLLGSCSSITVRGNANHVFWQSGSPIISDTGNANTIMQR